MPELTRLDHNYLFSFKTLSFIPSIRPGLGISRREEDNMEYADLEEDTLYALNKIDLS